MKQEVEAQTGSRKIDRQIDRQTYLYSAYRFKRVTKRLRHHFHAVAVDRPEVEKQKPEVEGHPVRRGRATDDALPDCSRPRRHHRRQRQRTCLPTDSQRMAPFLQQHSVF